MFKGLQVTGFIFNNAMYFLSVLCAFYLKKYKILLNKNTPGKYKYLKCVFRTVLLSILSSRCSCCLNWFHYVQKSQVPPIYLHHDCVYSNFIFLPNHNLSKLKQLHCKWCEFKQQQTVSSLLSGRERPAN